MQEIRVQFLGREDLLEKPTPVFLGFPCGSAGKESPCKVEDLGSIPGLGKSPGEGYGNPFQYPFLEKRSLVGCNQWGRKESGMTERLKLTYTSTKATYHNRLNAEAEMRIQLFSVKPDIREIDLTKCKAFPIKYLFVCFG